MFGDNNLDIDLCVYPTWSSLRFLDVYIHVFHQCWEVLGTLFLQLFFLPLSLLSFWDSC